MNVNDLINSPNNELGIKNIKIDDIYKVNDYLFIKLSNGQKILTKGNELYDVSEYSHLIDLIFMGDKFCAIFKKNFSTCVVDLKTMEVLFEDIEAYHVSKQDDRTLHIIKNIGCGNTTLYDIKTKKYLPIPENYEFEHSLENNLYVFMDNKNSDTNIYNDKRCVINANGKIIMKDIKGCIYLNESHIIIKKEDEICIVGINNESTLDIKTIKQNDEMIAKPAYYKGNIILIFNNSIKLYTPSLELIKEIKIENLTEVIDYEITSGTLKMVLPYTENDKKISKNLFVNLKSGKIISHIRIECFPYWTPTTYIGQDSINTDTTNYHFYNQNFELIMSINAYDYDCVDDSNECIFVITTIENGNKKRQLLNTKNGSIRKIDYNFIKFPVDHQDGYGINFTTKKMEFFDENLSIIFPNFDYEKYRLEIDDFEYFIVNNYLCVIKPFVGNYGESEYRTIIQNSDGEIILDSIKHRCFQLGNFIQIICDNKSEFLNTLTGEVGQLGISTKVDEKGKIDLKGINNIDSLLTINSCQLLLTSTDEQNPKTKKLLPEEKK